MAFSVFLYNYTIHRPRTRALLRAHPLGFPLGFMSDLESLNYFGGVFGGYGFGDGDFVFPLSFMVGTVLFSLSWRPILDRANRLGAWFEKKLGVPPRVPHERGQARQVEVGAAYPDGLIAAE